MVVASVPLRVQGIPYVLLAIPQNEQIASKNVAVFSQCVRGDFNTLIITLTVSCHLLYITN